MAAGAQDRCPCGVGHNKMVKTKARTSISPAQLYAILDREWKKRRPAKCKNCRIPLPYWRQPPDEVSANWHIGTPKECPHGCDAIIAELLAELWTRYDIEKGLEQ